MPTVQHWSSIIILCAAACVLIEFLIPQGSVGKIMNSVLGVFMLCAVILPFTNQKIKFDLNLKNLQQKKETNEKKFSETLEGQTENIFKSSMKSVVAGVLRDINVTALKIEIFMDKSEEGSISIIKCKVFVDKRDEERTGKIKEEIEGKLKISAEVLADV